MNEDKIFNYYFELAKAMALKHAEKMRRSMSHRENQAKNTSDVENEAKSEK